MTDDQFSSINFKKKVTRTPKIITFEERNKITGYRKRKPIITNTENEDENLDFVNVARDVKNFGMTGFNRIDQKKNQQQYAESLGAYKRKGLKVPYPLLMEQRKRKKEKEEKSNELDRAMGIFKKKKTDEKVDIREKYNLGRWVDKSKLGKITRTNSIKVNEKEIAKVARKK